MANGLRSRSNTLAANNVLGMRISRHGRLPLALLVAGCIIGFVPNIAAATPPVAEDWNDYGVSTGVWNSIPGSTLWGSVPVGVPGNPDQYKLEFLCLVGESSFDKPCLAATIQCTAGKDGRPVNWYSSPKAINPPAWTFYTGPTCVYSENPRDVLAEIAARIEQDFKNSNVAAATVTSQPGPNTLRGAETNFYAEAKEQTFDIELLGQHVHINATPTEYTWTYGDGATLGPTPYPGASLPELRWGEKTTTSHVYTQTGDYPVTVATHFQGTYSVNGGPPLPIPGQGSFTSTPVQVSVWRSETKNYADNCNQNPNGNGCPGAPAGP